MWSTAVAFAAHRRLGLLDRRKPECAAHRRPATLAGSVLFFAVTNFAVWMFAGLYTHDAALVSPSATRWRFRSSAIRCSATRSTRPAMFRKFRARGTDGSVSESSLPSFVSPSSDSFFRRELVCLASRHVLVENYQVMISSRYFYGSTCVADGAARVGLRVPVTAFAARRPWLPRSRLDARVDALGGRVRVVRGGGILRRFS